jgi:hypothetical protein
MTHKHLAPGIKVADKKGFYYDVFKGVKEKLLILKCNLLAELQFYQLSLKPYKHPAFHRVR